jgi:NADPH:quinone reductase
MEQIMKAYIPSTDAQRLVALADVPEPEAAPDEAIVEVAAFSINRGETFLLERPPQDWRPGKDIAGMVLRAAADGSGPAVAERVVAHPSSAG